MKTLEYILIAAIIIFEASALLVCSGILKGKLITGHFGWYTNLSNYLVLFGYIYVLICRISQQSANAVFMLMMTLAILLTHWIYAFILFPVAYRQTKKGTCQFDIKSYDNITLHFVAPILAIAYWFIFADKSLTYLDGLKWLLIPSLYIVYVVIRVKLNIKIADDGEVYPYFFMNVNKIGLKKTIMNIVLLGIACAVIGEIFVWIGGLF